MTSVRRWALALAAGAVPVGVLVVFFVVPVAGIVSLGFFDEQGDLDLGAVAAVLTRPRTGQVVWFTMWTSTVATAVTLLLGVPTALVLYRRRVWGTRLLRGLVAVPFVLPTVVVGVAFRTLLVDSGPLGFLGWDGSAWGIVAALVFFNVSVVVRIVGPYWAGMDPRPAQAAAALGASNFHVARTVTWARLAPVIGSAAAVVFLFCATAFGVVLTLGGVRFAGVETEIYLLTTQFLDLQGAAALSLLQLVFVIALLALTATRRPVRVRRAARPEPAPLAWSDTPAVLAAGLVGLLIVLPLATLVVRSLRISGSGGSSSWTLANYEALFADPDSGSSVLQVSAWAAAQTSMRIAFDATLLAMGLGVTIALLVTRRPGSPGLRRAASGLDALFMLPLGVSAVTVGFGFLVALDNPPFDFRGSPWLILVAQGLVALPLVIRTLVPPLKAIDQRTREAAASLGANGLRVLATTDLVAIRRPLIVAAGFALAVSLGEFGATAFLSRPAEPTLPVLIYQLLSRPGADNFGAALAAAVVLGAVTATVLVGAEKLAEQR